MAKGPPEVVVDCRFKVAAGAPVCGAQLEGCITDLPECVPVRAFITAQPLKGGVGLEEEAIRGQLCERFKGAALALQKGRPKGEIRIDPALEEGNRLPQGEGARVNYQA